MSETRKSRLCEVLGVEVNEQFTFLFGADVHYVKCWIDEDGIAYGKREGKNWIDKVDSHTLCQMINHPESIVRLPRLTEPELAICKAVGARWVSMDKGSIKNPPSWAYLWSEKPDEDEGFFDGDVLLAQVARELFPSVHPGDCIEVAGTAKGVVSDG